MEQWNLGEHHTKKTELELDLLISNQQSKSDAEAK